MEFSLTSVKFSHEYWMSQALKRAQYAWNIGEVPVGAVLVYHSKLIGEGWNQQINRHDPTAHAEVLALRQGGLALKNYRLLNCTLYVTLEPCAMCSGAVIYGRINTLVYGICDKKAGAAGSLINVFKRPEINHRITIIKGILATECSNIINNFFLMRRFQKKQKKLKI